MPARKQWEWEEDAYLLGVAHVLAKPVRGKLLNTLLDAALPRARSQGAVPTHRVGCARERRRSRLCRASARAARRCGDFPGVLTHSLDSAALLKQFLLLLREIIGVNRAIIFLRKPAAMLSESPLAPDDRWLRSACAIGLDHSVLQHFALSLGAGIGGHLHRQGRILRDTQHRGASPAARSPRNSSSSARRSPSRSSIASRCSAWRSSTNA